VLHYFDKMNGFFDNSERGIGWDNFVVGINEGDLMSNGDEWPLDIRSARVQDGEDLGRALVRVIQLTRNPLDAAFFVEKHLPSGNYKSWKNKGKPALKFLTEVPDPKKDDWVSDPDARMPNIRARVIEAGFNNPDHFPNLHKALSELKLLP
jgi:hypothetical protein